jgi:hypothetical protein
MPTAWRRFWHFNSPESVPPMACQLAGDGRGGIVEPRLEMLAEGIDLVLLDYRPTPTGPAGCAR